MFESFRDHTLVIVVVLPLATALPLATYLLRLHTFQARSQPYHTDSVKFFSTPDTPTCR